MVYFPAGGELPEPKGKVEGKKTKAEGFETPWQSAAGYLEGMAAKEMDLGSIEVIIYI